jgi:hypothetical protein
VTLELAAASRGEKRRRLLGRIAAAENLALVGALLQHTEGATLKRERADDELRTEAAHTLRAVRDLLERAR